MYALLQRLNILVESILGKVITVMFAVMVAVSFCQVLTRYIEYPLYWSEELARYLAVWLTFLGASYALRRKALALVEAILTVLKPHQKRILAVFICLLVILFCLFLCVYGTSLVLRMSRQTSPAMFLSMGYVYSSAPVSGAIMLLFTLEQLLDIFFKPNEEA